MSLAPTTSPIPPMRPELALEDGFWLALGGSGSPGLAEAASAQAMVMFCWLLVLTSLGLWVRRRAAAGDVRLFGRWQQYDVRRDTQEAAPCQWQVGAARMASGQQKWHCDVCGRDGFSSTKGPPEGCSWPGRR